MSNYSISAYLCQEVFAKKRELFGRKRPCKQKTGSFAGIKIFNNVSSTY